MTTVSMRARRKGQKLMMTIDSARLLFSRLIASNPPHSRTPLLLSISLSIILRYIINSMALEDLFCSTDQPNGQEVGIPTAHSSLLPPPSLPVHRSIHILNFSLIAINVSPCPAIQDSLHTTHTTIFRRGLYTNLPCKLDSGSDSYTTHEIF